jgi:hypothetical protein
MKHILLSAAFLSALAAPVAISAQSNPLVGKWRVEYERGRRIENGTPTPMMGTGTLTIAPQGDSLSATLETGPRPDGTPAPPSTFGGRQRGAEAVFVQNVSVQMNMNGELRTTEMTMTWTLSATGDSLTGTLLRAAAAMPQGSTPTPVKGTRIAGQ